MNDAIIKRLEWAGLYHSIDLDFRFDLLKQFNYDFIAF